MATNWKSLIAFAALATLIASGELAQAPAPKPGVEIIVTKGPSVTKGRLLQPSMLECQGKVVATNSTVYSDGKISQQTYYALLKVEVKTFIGSSEVPVAFVVNNSPNSTEPWGIVPIDVSNTPQGTVLKVTVHVEYVETVVNYDWSKGPAPVVTSATKYPFPKLDDKFQVLR